MKKEWVVYQHISTVTGKSYIGITCTGVKNRWHHHCSEAKLLDDTHFHRAIRKYGKEAWVTKILEKGIYTLDEANAKEDMCIQQHNTVQCGYNSKSGGELTIDSEATKIKKRAATRLYHGTKKVSLYNIKTNEKLHGYPGDLERLLNYPASTFSGIVSGARRSIRGWVIDTPENRKYKPVKKHWFYHELFGTDYASLDDMCRKYPNITSRGNLSMVISEKRKTHQGWKLITKDNKCQ